MTIDQIIKGLAAYIEGELLPVLEGKQLWLTYFGLGLIQSQAGHLVINLLNNPWIEMLGIIDKNGNINIEPALNTAKITARQFGKLEVNIPLIGCFKFGEAEFDLIGQYIADAKNTDSESMVGVDEKA